MGAKSTHLDQSEMNFLWIKNAQTIRLSEAKETIESAWQGMIFKLIHCMLELVILPGLNFS